MKEYFHAWNSVFEGLPRPFWRLLKNCGDIKYAWDKASDGELEKAGIRNIYLQRLKEFRSNGKPFKIFKNLSKDKIQILTFRDSNYPIQLRSLNNHLPPAVLYVRGNLPDEKSILVSIVGTRDMTGYGEQIAKQIVRSLKHHNVIIVSGMARGIDMTAHLAALESGLKTIAVLGSGLKKIPFYNYSIASMIANSGAVITEYPPFTIGQKYNFPLRNRIISGLSKVTVIVEAGEKSGALITAQYALDQSREVLAVPGNIANEKSKGTNRIIKDSGAALLKEPEDILEVLGISQKTAKTSKFLTVDQKKIVEALNKNSLSHSSLIKETQFAANKLNSTLTELEIDGLIDRNKDGKYFLKY